MGYTYNNRCDERFA